MANNTVCLCGSTKFLKDFEDANRELTKRGLSVISISFAMPRRPDGSHEEDGPKEYLDLVHLNKILRSDAIFVVGDGYIGRSTAREILWAHMQDKPIIWQKRCENWDITASSIRYGAWHTNIVPLAKEKPRACTMILSLRPTHPGRARGRDRGA